MHQYTDASEPQSLTKSAGASAELMTRRTHVSAPMAGRLLMIFAPILALAAAAVALAIAAWTRASYREELVFAAMLAMIAAGLVAMVLLHRQVRQRQRIGRAVLGLEARVSDIVESAMDPIVTVDDQQRVVLFNAAAEKAFRWPRNAVIGQPLDMLIPEQYRHAHRAHVEGFGATGVTSRRMGAKLVLMALRADGGQFPIDASISQHQEDGREFYTVILRDVSERMHAEEQVMRSEARLRGILDSAMDAIITIDE
jgi:PAS domain S-box-containing protein